MVDRQTMGRRPSRRAAVQQTAAHGVIFLIAIAGTIALLWRASDIWAATHGYGVAGRWTPTDQETGGKMIRWYGEFAPDGGGRIRPEVPMEGYVNGKDTVRAVYRSGTAYVVPGSAQWAALVLVALGPLAMAALMASFIVESWRRPRRRVALSGPTLFPGADPDVRP